MKRFAEPLGRGLLAVAGLTLLAGLGTAIFGASDLTLPLICAGMFCGALASFGHPRLHPWLMLIWLSTAIVAGLAFPTWFIGVGDFKFTRLFIPILQLIMFGLGTTLSVTDFARVARRPGAVFAGITCQFTIMPLVGCGLAHLSGFPPEIGAGIILVGSAPSGLASTVMVYFARADVALSVTLTAVISLLAPVMTPFLVQWLAGTMIQIDAGKLMWDLTKMTVFPVLAGLLWHHWVRDRAKLLSRLLPLLSVAGIIVMTVLTVAVGRDNLLKLGVLLVAVCFVHTTVGYLLGYLTCRGLRFDETTCRTIAFEVGMQNAGLASAVAASLNKVGTFGLAPIVFGPVMNLTASTLANWWRNRPVPATPRCE